MPDLGAPSPRKLAGRAPRFAVWGIAAVCALVLLETLALRRRQPLAPPEERPAVTADTPQLTAGLFLERVITARETHTYVAHLDKGQALRLTVLQRAVDLVLKVHDPDGALLLEVDGPNGPDGLESIAMIARATGAHPVTVAAPTTSGAYTLRVESLGPASDRDRAWASGLEAYVAAERLRRADGSASLEEALEGYRTAYDHWRGEAHLLAARAQRRSGQILEELGRIPAALEHFEDAAETYGDRANGWELIPLYNDLGAAYREVGEHGRARASFERAVTLAREIGHHRALATAFNNLGALDQAAGHFQQALDAYDQALDIWQGLGLPGRRATVLHNIGITLTSLGYLEEARDHLKESLSLHAAGSSSWAATAMAIGWSWDLDGDLTTALARYDEALVIWRASEERSRLATVQDLRGTALRKLRRPDESRTAYQEALTIARDLGNPVSEAHTLDHLGALAVLQRRPEEALRHANQAIALFRRLHIPEGEASALATGAKAERLLGRLHKALERLEKTLALVESVRGRLQSRQFRRSYLAQRFSEFEDYIDLLMELDAGQPAGGFAEQAFSAAEGARARGLLESLTEARAHLRNTAPPDLVRAEQRLRAEIHARETARIALLGRGLEDEVAELEGQLRAQLLAYEKFRTEHCDGPILEPLPPIGLRQIQEEILDPETQMLSYILGEQRSFLWLVSATSFESFELPGRSTIESLAGQAARVLARSRRWDLRRQTTFALRALSDRILAPAVGKLNRRRLVIVADGTLQTIPFAALPVPGPAGLELGSGWRPLIADHEIVRLPSATVLARMRQDLARRPSPPKLLAVVADPVFEASDPRLPQRTDGLGAAQTVPCPNCRHPSQLERAMRDFEALRLDRLPYSGSEAEAILSLVPSGLRLAALGPRASRDVVTSGELADYSAVHFATHGLINQRHPELSGIVLSLFDEEGRPRDGFLHLNEIFDLDLPIDLVVLSACRTALGQQIRGEGLVGLTHGFYLAGVPRVVVSLWNVDDRATATLMTYFYEGIFERHWPPARALREAQLKVREDPRRSAPYYWAGFVLQGEWR